MALHAAALYARITKLHEHATSAQALGSEAEASAFMAKVHDLLIAHDLALADVLAQTGESPEAIAGEWFWIARARRRQAPEAWWVLMATAVAALHGAHAMFAMESSDVYLTGRKANRDAAALVAMTLHDAAVDGATAATAAFRQAVLEQTNTTQIGNYRAAWLWGFAMRVEERARALHDAGGRGTALVSRAGDEAREAAERGALGRRQQLDGPTLDPSDTRTRAGVNDGVRAGGDARFTTNDLQPGRGDGSA